MAEPLRHRQTKEAATDMFSLQPPRYIPTLPDSEPPTAGPASPLTLCGAFGGYETEIPHQLAGVLKARQIADLGQHRHCRNEIYPAHRLQGCDELGKGPLGHRVTDRLLQTSMDYNFSNLLSYNNGLVNKAVSSVTQGVQNSLSETVLTHPSHPCLTCRQADRQRIRTVKRFRRCLALV